jgi:hypothetical protein
LGAGDYGFYDDTCDYAYPYYKSLQQLHSNRLLMSVKQARHKLCIVSDAEPRTEQVLAPLWQIYSRRLPLQIHFGAARKVAFAAKVHNACRVGHGPVHPSQLVMGDTSTLHRCLFAAWWAAT